MMMKRSIVGIAAALALGGPVAAGAADDAVAVQAAMKTAQHNVQSFRLDLSSPAAGMTGTGIVTNAPKRMHLQVASGPMVIEMYLADGYLYQRIGSSAWQKRSVPDGKALLDISAMFNEKVHAELAPDLVDAGATYGAIVLEVDTATIPGAPSVGPMKLTCAYDKTTYLVHTCTNQFFSEKLYDYNDPSNAVTLPPALATAVDAGPLFPPPASPAPAAAPSSAPK